MPKSNARGNLIFRSWAYFRLGWAGYLTFIMGAVNTLTVTYYLAVENYTFLQDLFPTFPHYAVIVLLVVIPSMILVGYVHFKRSPAYRSDVSIHVESNPYTARQFTNSNITMILNVHMLSILNKLARNEKIPEAELDEINELHKLMTGYLADRKFDQKTDLAFYARNFENI